MCSSQGGSSDSSNARYAKWNKIFHSILARATQNQVFVRLMDGVLVAYEQATLTLGRENFNYSSGMWPPESVDEHQNILNAIESQDEEKAVAYILKHLDLAAFRIKGLTCKFNIKMPAESIKWRGEYQAENEERENAN
ncbi:hypothetical protein AGMMS50276_04470 [Synergistales bacterium]|nr:hypothetical protein AGMMS50276_04470 [Synergistales bacterium]